MVRPCFRSAPTFDDEGSAIVVFLLQVGVRRTEACPAHRDTLFATNSVLQYIWRVNVSSNDE